MKKSAVTKITQYVSR